MNVEYEYALGQNIRRLRIQLGLTQEQVAAQLQVRGCDVTRSALAKIEVGQRHIYPEEIRLLREILKVSYDELFNLITRRTHYRQGQRGAAFDPIFPPKWKKAKFFQFSCPSLWNFSEIFGIIRIGNRRESFFGSG